MLGHSYAFKGYIVMFALDGIKSDNHYLNSVREVLFVEVLCCIHPFLSLKAILSKLNINGEKGECAAKRNQPKDFQLFVRERCTERPH